MRNYILLIALFSAGCGQHMAALPTIKPYKMDIQQGNVVTPKMMMQLRPGMNKSQVRFIMGTPLLVDSFHADRWDYFYQMRKQGKIIEQRRVILEFENDALVRVRGDVIPAGSDPNVKSVEPVSEPTSSTTPSKRDEKGWLDKLKFWESDDKAKANKPVPENKPAAEPKAEQKAEPAVVPAVVPAQEQAAPASKLPEIAPQPIPETLPPLMEEAPAAAPAPSKEVAPAATPVAKPVEKAAPAKPVEAPKPVAPVVAPKEAAPVEKPAVKQETTVKEEAKPAAKTEAAKPSRPLSKTPPAPPKDLPPEEAPDFFEKMLEKIGF